MTLRQRKFGELPDGLSRACRHVLIVACARLAIRRRRTTVVQAASGGDADPPAPSNHEGAALSAAIAKWLIPSAAIGFGVVGYVVQTAQQELLGLSDKGFDSKVYFLGAADFLRDTAYFLLGQEGGVVGPLANGADRWLAAMSTAVLVCLSLLWLFERVLVSRHRWLMGLVRAAPIMLIVLIVAAKFILLDAPISSLRGAILGNGDVSPVTAGASESAQTFARHGASTFVERVLGHGVDAETAATEQVPAPGRRTLALWRDVVCSRISADTPFHSGLYGDPAKRCRFDAVQSQKNLDAFYRSEFWLMGLLAVLSLVSVWVSPHNTPGVIVAIFIGFYSVSLPYAYGKLMRSTYYDYGLVTLSTGLKADYGLASKAPLFGLLISRSAEGANLLVIQRGQCDPGTPPFRLVKQASVSNSDLLSIEEIYRQDVLTWALEQQSPCHRCPPDDLSCNKL